MATLYDKDFKNPGPSIMGCLTKIVAEMQKTSEILGQTGSIWARKQFNEQKTRLEYLEGDINNINEILQKAWDEHGT